ncbi:MAG: ATP-binding protein [Robiginitomaculum sp.]|nr:ATP-binding protein [Robiginitomaculum sp.]
MNFSINRGLPLISILWCLALLAALIAAYFKGVDAMSLLPFAGVAIAPAIIGLLLWPFSRREWVQMLVIFSWIALAIVACFAIAFVPMAILFLCAPAAAALFEREKVVEAMVFSAIFAAGVFYFGKLGYAPDPIANSDQASWGELAGIMATIAFMIGAMFFAASSKRSPNLGDTDLGNTNLDGTAHTKDNAYRFAEAYPGAVMEFSANGDLQMATPTARTLFGIGEDRADHITLSNLGLDETQEHALVAAFEDMRETGTQTSININIPRNYQEGSGTSMPYTELTLVPQNDGSVFAFTSERSRAEDTALNLSKAQAQTQETQANIQAQASAKKEYDEKTLFFAGVSHELRTPLNAIIGFSDMMRSRLFGPLPGKYAEYADLIHDSGQHMLDLVGDVLDMSKVEANKYELNYSEFDAADVVRSSIKMVRPSADAAELVLGADIAANTDLDIQADRRAVRQIMLNLLSNAIKFTPKGGRVTTYAHIVRDRLELSVEDTGTGMTAGDIENIGSPYQQASNANLVKARGTGLGLSLVKNLVSLHGGDFDITSHPGVGTKVKVSLPLIRST